MSRDPLGASPYWSEHSYGYAADNPVNYVDPRGLNPAVAGAAVLGPVGVVGAAGVGACLLIDSCSDAAGAAVSQVAGGIKNVLSKKGGKDESAQLKTINSLAARLAEHCAYPVKPQNVQNEIRAFRKNIQDAISRLGPNGKKKAADILRAWGSTINCDPNDPGMVPPVPPPGNDDPERSEQSGFRLPGKE